MLHGQTTTRSLLLRLVDDFMFLSTDLSTARRFVATMHAKIPHYCCIVHAAKTQVSVLVDPRLFRKPYYSTSISFHAGKL